MQKRIGTLTLSKETLRNLDDQELAQVAGGVTLTPVCLTLGTGTCSYCTKNCSVCCL